MEQGVLITGANGFVGSALSERLAKEGYQIKAGVRDAAASLHSSLQKSSTAQEWVTLNDRSTEEELRAVLRGIDIVVHLAARVHHMEDRSLDSAAEYRRINVDWTERLGRAAAREGVERFVLLSSSKVFGEQSVRPFSEEDRPNPCDAYGVSKWEAEQALARVSAETGMEAVVLRSPLVYGPAVTGNMLQLLKILERRIPLPFAAVQNRRSLIYRGNLVDALSCCLREARAAGQTYVVSDGEDLSTPELIQRLSGAMGISARLWYVPPTVLRWVGRVAGKQRMVDRLLGSLQVDSSKIRRELDWRPPYSIDHGFAETAAWFCAHASG